MARPDQPTLKAWRNVLEVWSVVSRALDEELRAQAGFGIDWYDVLLQLHEAGGRLRMRELADATLFTRANCTRLVDRMSKAGYVAREPDAHDGRGVVAVLTAEGKGALRRAAPAHLAGIEAHFGRHLPDGSAAAVGRALHRVVAAERGWRS